MSRREKEYNERYDALNLAVSTVDSIPALADRDPSLNVAAHVLAVSEIYLAYLTEGYEAGSDVIVSLKRR